jgi:putative transcriptional regulator
MITAVEDMEEAVASEAENRDFRVFAGYSGWGAGQLDSELMSDSWFVFEAGPDLAFDPEPKTLWDRLIEVTELRIAGLRPPAARE